mmetsp:Transcript_96919/g.260652  ORF Transcript_96919/g.260652 Transcript_96919/m.260652 type:complete len:317 (-) Transcript_96919:203-1153(-)
MVTTTSKHMNHRWVKENSLKDYIKAKSRRAVVLFSCAQSANAVGGKLFAADCLLAVIVTFGIIKPDMSMNPLEYLHRHRLRPLTLLGPLWVGVYAITLDPLGMALLCACPWQRGRLRRGADQVGEGERLGLRVRQPRNHLVFHDRPDAHHDEQAYYAFQRHGDRQCAMVFDAVVVRAARDASRREPAVVHTRDLRPCGRERDEGVRAFDRHGQVRRDGREVWPCRGRCHARGPSGCGPFVSAAHRPGVVDDNPAARCVSHAPQLHALVGVWEPRGSRGPPKRREGEQGERSPEDLRRAEFGPWGQVQLGHELGRPR